MKIIKGDWVMEKDEFIEEDLRVLGNIYGKDGQRFNLNCRNLDCWNLNCKNLNCRNLNCRNLNCMDLNCKNLNCRNLDCWNLNCKNLNCKNLNCMDLDFYAVAVAYNSFKCRSWKAKREKYIIKCLDGEIEIKKDEVGEIEK